jgi:hypothetical protein
MLKKLVLTVVVLAALLVYAVPAQAQSGVPTTYYVNTSYTGTTEAGTPSQPFKTLEAAVAAGQAQPYGAYIYTWNATTSAWVYYGFIAPVNNGGTGSPIAGPVLFGLLALLCVGLIAGGWFLLRRSRTGALPA